MQDEWKFSSSVRIAVPGSGLGSDLMAMHEWLRLRTGSNSNYAFHGDLIPGRFDAMKLYVHDPYQLHEFLARFQLEPVGYQSSSAVEVEYGGWGMPGDERFSKYVGSKK